MPAAPEENLTPSKGAICGGCFGASGETAVFFLAMIFS